jgi:NAD-dependent dihydropyrimidine dehydrogenase PreA subunit
MTEDVYTRLREFLDNMPYGYPTTESGVEMKILKKLFTPDRAEIAMKLTPMPEPVAQIAPRLGMDEAQAEETLESMAQDGLIMRMRAGDQAMYGAVSYMVGIYEFQIKTIDRELSELMEEYLPHLWDVWKSKTKALRVVPVGTALEGDKQVATYNQVQEILKGKQLIAVAPCICTKEQEQLGNTCDRPQERCILFDAFAQYYMDNGMARQIDEKELADLLKMGEEQALVLSPTNAKEIMNICLCCKCCCAILGMLQKFERPADQIISSYQAKIDPDLCVLCGTCEDRCQVAAIKEGDEAYEVDTARCIGCGVCVPTCPEEAISLVDKAPTDTVPENFLEMQIKLAQERGVG